VNIAFPAFLIVLYIFPGIALAHALLASDSRLEGTQQPDWSAQIAIGSILALPIHLLWLTMAGHFAFFDSVPNIEDAIKLLSDKNGEDTARIARSIAQYYIPITLYFSSATLIPFVLGRYFLGPLLSASRLLSLKSPWDARFKIKADHKLLVTAVIAIGGTPYLYVGVYVSRIINEKGRLEGIWISSPKRRLLGNDNRTDPEAEEFYPIETDVLFLAADKIQTVSVKEFKDSRSEETRKIAHALWKERKSKEGDVGSPELDWLRAELIYLYRKQNSRLRNTLTGLLPGEKERRYEKEQGLKELQMEAFVQNKDLQSPLGKSPGTPVAA